MRESWQKYKGQVNNLVSCLQSQPPGGPEMALFLRRGLCSGAVSPVLLAGKAGRLIEVWKGVVMPGRELKRRGEKGRALVPLGRAAKAAGGRNGDGDGPEDNLRARAMMADGCRAKTPFLAQLLQQYESASLARRHRAICRARAASLYNSPQKTEPTRHLLWT